MIIGAFYKSDLKSSNSHTCLLQFMSNNSSKIPSYQSRQNISILSVTNIILALTSAISLILFSNEIPSLWSPLLPIFNISIKTKLKYLSLRESSSSDWKIFYSIDIVCTPNFAFYPLSFFPLISQFMKLSFHGFMHYLPFLQIKIIKLRSCCKIILMIIYLHFCSFIFQIIIVCWEHAKAVVRY